MEDYQALCLQDNQLSFRVMDQGQLKYIGQVRMMEVYQESLSSNERAHRTMQQGTTPSGKNQGGNQTPIDYEYVKCGYGKMVWPDGSSFEGYWINGQPLSVGVFRAPEPLCETYQGFWQQDRQTNLSVFRQNVGNDIQADLE